MKTIGAYEAKTHFSRLLDEVSEGQTITITKHGRPIARLVPPGDQPQPSPGEAVAALREFRKRTHATLGDLTICELIDEGRM
ncbi:MAG TPA: type II toxin-antitoxin system prevent-host-death family antitoxin [Thermomicrobiales bacterium]|nr:type II toxin-antitoxin system prevent-host-death family antitoxin [Thermomicrobiales bacterium]